MAIIISWWDALLFIETRTGQFSVMLLDELEEKRGNEMGNTAGEISERSRAISSGRCSHNDVIAFSRLVFGGWSKVGW